MSPLKRLRTVGKLEGISFLLLLGVGMPLKYAAGYPIAVKVAGWIHGVLFILFCFALQRAKQDRGWSVREASIFLIAALLPFGPFVVDRRLAAQEHESPP